MAACLQAYNLHCWMHGRRSADSGPRCGTIGRGAAPDAVWRWPAASCNAGVPAACVARPQGMLGGEEVGRDTGASCGRLAHPPSQAVLTTRDGPCHAAWGGGGDLGTLCPAAAAAAAAGRCGPCACRCAGRDVYAAMPGRGTRPSASAPAGGRTPRASSLSTAPVAASSRRRFGLSSQSTRMSPPPDRSAAARVQGTIDSNMHGRGVICGQWVSPEFHAQEVLLHRTCTLSSMQTKTMQKKSIAVFYPTVFKNRRGQFGLWTRFRYTSCPEESP